MIRPSKEHITSRISFLFYSTTKSAISAKADISLFHINVLIVSPASISHETVISTSVSSFAAISVLTVLQPFNVPSGE